MKLVKVENGIKLVVSKGAKGDSIQWKGEWSPTVVYESVHVVSRGGASWISKQSANIGHDPLADDGIWWDCMVADSLAEAARDKAQKWAENPEDVPVEPGKYSALHHAAKAEDAAVNAASEAVAAVEPLIEKARQWAENPEDVEVEPGQYSALHHKEKALDAQVAAETAEVNAQASENKAYKWAEEAVDVEVEGGKYSALHHSVKASEAKDMAEDARDLAIAAKDKAEKWAQEDEDIVVEDGKYSAYHWAQKAGQIAVSPPHGDEAHTEDYIKEGDPRLT